jgi:hypothetical protein
LYKTALTNQLIGGAIACIPQGLVTNKITNGKAFFAMLVLKAASEAAIGVIGNQVNPMHNPVVNDSYSAKAGAAGVGAIWAIALLTMAGYKR